MRERRLRLPVSRLTLALADASGTSPAPILQGPSSVSASQPFQISFYYPKGQIKKWQMDLSHCPSGATLRPSDDSNQEPFPGQGCEVPRGIEAPISPDTGNASVDARYGRPRRACDAHCAPAQP